MASSYSSMTEQEIRRHAMIRRMSGDVRDAVRSQIYELYDADESLSFKSQTYKESCARWHWLLIVYAKDPEEVDQYIDFIQIAFSKQMNLDQSNKWKFLMRMTIPTQFIQKIEAGFQPVTRLAIMDQTPLRKNTASNKPRAIFRR